jgi:hypothetical protein
MTPQMPNNSRKHPTRTKKAPAVSNAELPPIGDVLKSMKDILREDGLLPKPNRH